MGKAKWWVCDDCKSLNDLPANKCYKCFTSKPDSPSLMDDQYGHVGGGESQRVGVTVDLDMVGDLTAPDPVETADGGGLVEAYGFDDDKPLASTQTVSTPAVTPPPLREPERRSISQIASRHWTDGQQAPTTTAPPPASPPPATAPPQAMAPPPASPPALSPAGAPPDGASPSRPPPLAPMPSPPIGANGPAED